MGRLTDERSRGWLRIAAFAVTAGIVGYLAVLAIYPTVRTELPPWLSWFGAPGSVASIMIACIAIGLACAVGWRSGFGQRSVGGPIGITLVLTVISAVLGFSSYAWCHDDGHPALITPLLWTGSLIKGGIDDHRLGVAAQTCPAAAPVALDVARVSTLAAILIGIFGIVVALLQSRLDRLRIRFDNSITAVIGADDQADSMVNAVANTLERNSRLVIITTFADAQRRSELRHAGHRIVVMDPDKPDALQSLPIWRKVTRLYLLSPDPATNLRRLRFINRCLPADRNRRLPLTVRIDDPWQAEAWRAQQLGGSDRRWVADAVGKYEVTAHRLLDSLVDEGHVGRIIVCGTTPLTLAICANLVRRRLERDFYSEPLDSPLPSLTIVADRAEEYRRDEEFHLAQRGIAPAGDWLQAVPQRPSVSTLTSLLAPAPGEKPVDAAVVITEASCDPMLGTLLAAHFPAVPIYAYSPDAPEFLDAPSIVGRLHTFRLTMDLPPGHSLDVWERAAMLIHNRYAAQFPGSSPASRPWAELDEFYRGSNRRQVRNALWMVDQIAGHTWDTSGSPAELPLGARTAALAALERLAQLGIDRDTALAMAKAEHEDWCRYYHRAGWHYGPVRDDTHKIHDGLVSWESIESDPPALNRALSSLAATLSALRELGFRSRPVWQQFRRTGTVEAQQRDQPWSWTSASGRPMHAGAGDWSVRG
ncbi:MAG TPA: RyR domain-containing protein, partial [Mycobacterium sp.]|nr:RyR domain-containing protein [Mycobacterium sp.]